MTRGVVGVGSVAVVASRSEVAPVAGGSAPLVQRAVLAVPVVVLAVGAWSYRYISDDGFINLRVVSQLVHGNGPVFNAGERVEAVTSPLWVGVLALADVATPVRLEWLAVLLGIGLTLWGLVAAIGAARGLAGVARPGVVVVPAGALVYAALPPAWEYSSSGLEGGLDRAWLGTMALLFVRVAASERPEWTGRLGLALVVGLGPLIRPDFGLFWVVFVAAVMVSAGAGVTLVDRLRWVGVAAAPPLVMELFRIGYYGSLLPNTAYAKEAGEPRLGEGWDYLWGFVRPYWLWVPLVVLAVSAVAPLLVDLSRAGARARREQVLVAAFVVGGLAHGAYVVAIGGDFMHARLLMPALFAVLVPVAVVPIERSRALAVVVVPWAIFSLAVLRNPAIDPDELRPGTPREFSMLISGNAHPVTTDDWQGSLPRPGADLTRRVPGIYLGGAERLSGVGGPLQPAADGPQVVVVNYAVGLSSYLQPVDVYVLDVLGLGDAFAAHQRLERRGLAGHEKALPPAWVWARFIDPDDPVDADLFRTPSLIADNTGTAIDEDQTDSELAADIVAAREALACPEVERLTRVTRDRLTLGRVVDNFTDAFRLNGLRIPSDPQEAAGRFCPSS